MGTSSKICMRHVLRIVIGIAVLVISLLVSDASAVGESFSAAINISGTASGSVGQGGSVYYKFYVTSGQEATVTLIPSMGDQDLTVYNPSENYLSESRNAGTTADRVTFISSSSDNYYYARVYGYAAGSYSISVSVASTPSNPLTYPSDTWQRLWYKVSTSTPRDFTEFKGSGPNKDDRIFDDNWLLLPPLLRSPLDIDYIGFQSSRTVYLDVGTYKFTVGCDDGCKLWIDDSLEINEWHDQSFTEYNVEKTFLSNGNHRIRLDWYEKDLIAHISFKVDNIPQPNRIPNMPNLLTPSDGATVTTLAPTFSWSAFSDPDADNTQSAYQIRVLEEPDHDSLGTIIVMDMEIIGSASSITPSFEDYINGGLGNGKWYHWHVRVKDNQGVWSDWAANTPSTYMDFKIALQELSVSTFPTIVTARTATYVTFTVTSAGTAVSGAEVTLSGKATGSGTTGANGQVVMIVNAVDAGVIIATASKSGYTGGTTTLTVTPTPTATPTPTPTVTPSVNSTGNVIRRISPSVISPGSQINITLTPSPQDIFDNPGYRVVEILPSVFRFVGTPSGYQYLNNVYTFTQIGNNPIVYTLIAPNVEGNYTISGTFKDELQNTGIVTGTTCIKVGANIASSYDTNCNGRIDRNEAVQAVMDYFDGEITRQEAVEVVMVYFTG